MRYVSVVALLRLGLFDVAGVFENVLDAANARVESGVSRPAKVLVHERHLIVGAIAGEQRPRQVEVALNGGGRLATRLSSRRRRGNRGGQRERDEGSSEVGIVGKVRRLSGTKRASLHKLPLDGPSRRHSETR